MHGILSNGKCFLETILNDAARILSMDDMERMNSGCDPGTDSKRGRAEDTRSGYRRRSG
jgi:hypothetical protein